MRYRYSARTKDGRTIRGAIDAASRLEVEEALIGRGYLAVSVREQRTLGALEEFLRQLQRPRTRDVVVFLRQFSVMVAAKVPIVTALRSLIHQTAHAVLRAVIVDLAKDVESGRKLSDAFAAHPRVFSSFAVHIIHAGETSGELDAVLEYLADQAERDEELRSKVRGAMVYPAFIFGGLTIVAVIMMVFVIPRLTQVLTETGATLPAATRALIATSRFLAAWWWLLLALLVAAFAAFRWSLRSPAVRAGWDAVKLRLPILGPIIREVAVVRFTRSFGTLLRGGVDIVPGLEVIRGIMGNAVYERIIAETIREVRDGNSMATVFRRASVMPTMVSQLLAVGEETGRVEEVLGKLAAFYGREVDQRIRNLVTVIEPLVMIIMGVAVGVMVAAVIMPMYNLASQF